MRINRLVETIMILINKKHVTVKYLSNHFGVSRKTIYGDLDILLTSGIPVNYGDNHKGLVTILSGFDFHQKFQIKEKDEELKDYNYYKKYIDNEQHQNYTREMWEKFVSNRTKEVDELDSSIFHSWIRCQQKGVSIYTIDSSNLLTPEEINLYTIMNNNPDEDAIMFADLIKRLGWYVDIYSKDAKLLQIVNPVDNYEKLFPYVGYQKDCDEEIIGTNAVVLSLIEEKQKMVMGTQHYNKSFHDITNIAVPIYQNEQLYGVFNATFIHNATNPDIINIIKSMARLYEALVLKEHEVNIENEHIIHGDQEHITEIKEELLIGCSKSWTDVMTFASNLSIMDQDFIVFGESGIGKASLVKHIHNNSSRRYGPCEVIDLKEIPLSKQKKFLFGVEQNKIQGALEKAHGGSLIIKNVNFLNPLLMKAFNVFLESKKVKRVGSKKWFNYDVRVIFSYTTYHHMLDQNLQIKMPLVSLTIPSILKRKEDSEAIILHYLGAYFKSKGYNKGEISEIVCDIQLNYSKDGVRGIKNHILDLLNNNCNLGW